MNWTAGAGGKRHAEERAYFRRKSRARMQQLDGRAGANRPSSLDILNLTVPISRPTRRSLLAQNRHAASTSIEASVVTGLSSPRPSQLIAENVTATGAVSSIAYMHPNFASDKTSSDSPWKRFLGVQATADSMRTPLSECQDRRPTVQEVNGARADAESQDMSFVSPFGAKDRFFDSTDIDNLSHRPIDPHPSASPGVMLEPASAAAYESLQQRFNFFSESLDAMNEEMERLHETTAKQNLDIALLKRELEDLKSASCAPIPGEQKKSVSPTTRNCPRAGEDASVLSDFPAQPLAVVSSASRPAGQKRGTNQENKVPGSTKNPFILSPHSPSKASEILFTPVSDLCVQLDSS
ncbi:MAG: hypothetical protein SGCHY_000704 [Lobulomycetales sp.]